MENEEGTQRSTGCSEELPESTKSSKKPKSPKHEKYSDCIAKCYVNALVCGPFVYTRDTLDKHQGAIIAVASVITVIATIFIARLTSSISDDSKKQAEFVGRQVSVAEIDERAWITAPQITSGSACPGNQSPDTKTPDRVTFDFTFRNVGKTPSVGLYIKARYSLRADDQLRINDICEESIDFISKNNNYFRAWSIVPQDIFFTNNVDGQDFRDTPVADIAKLKEPEIIGCVTYGTRFDNASHHTKFAAPVIIKNGRVCIERVFTFDPT